MKKMRLLFLILALFLFSGSADAADWTGTWVNASSGSEFGISQNGQQINAVWTKPSAAASSQAGWKAGDVSFYGTLNGQKMTGKMHFHFPISYQTTCPAQWDWYDDLVLTISSDGNTLQGQTINSTINDYCVVTRNTASPLALTYTRKIEKGDVNGNSKIDLADVILALRISAGISVSQTIYIDADINGDKKIGIEEVIYTMQIISNLRNFTETFSNGTITLTATTTTSENSKIATVTDEHGNVILTSTTTLNKVILHFTGIDGVKELVFSSPLSSLPSDTDTNSAAVYVAGQILSKDSTSRQKRDNPGCDFFPDRPCALRCCSKHDECYDVNKCTKGSWLPFIGSDACDKCNKDAFNCIVTGGDCTTPQNRCYDRQCHQYFDCGVANCTCASPCYIPPVI